MAFKFHLPRYYPRSLFASQHYPDVKDLRVIGIMGSDHGGSTMLGAMLGSTPTNKNDIFHTGECYAYFGHHTPRHGPKCARHNPCPIWKNIPRENGWVSAYANIAKGAETGIIVDSSKRPQWFEKQYKVCTKNTWRFDGIVVWKDPIDLAYSYWKRMGLKRGLYPYLKAASFYKARVQLKRLKRTLDFETRTGQKFPIVKVNSLANHPAETLQKICNIVNLPYFKEKELYWNFDHHHLYGSRTQRIHVNTPEDASIFGTQEKSTDFPAEYYKDLTKGYEDLVENLRSRSI